MEAIKRGEVTEIKTEAGIKFYMFPKLDFHRMQKMKNENKISRSHAIDHAQFGEIADTMDQVQFQGADATPLSIDADSD